MIYCHLSGAVIGSSADLTKASYFSTTCHIETTFHHPVNSQWTKPSRFSLGNTPHYRIKYLSTSSCRLWISDEAGDEKLDCLCIYITFLALIMYRVEMYESLLNVKYVMQTLLRVMKASNIVLCWYCLYTALDMTILLKSFYIPGNISISAVRISKNFEKDS